MRITSNVTTGDDLISQNSLPLICGQEYAAFCYARRVSGDNVMKLQIGSDVAGYQSKTFYTTDEWQAYTCTFTATMTVNLYAGFMTNAVGIVEICGLTFTAGNKTTGWCPSPWDMASRAEFNALADRVAALEAK